MGEQAQEEAHMVSCLVIGFQRPVNLTGTLQYNRHIYGIQRKRLRIGAVRNPTHLWPE